MALTKEQGYALYLLLSVDSDLSRKLKQGQYEDLDSFFSAMQTHVSAIDPGATLDAGLKNLYSGPAPGGGTLMDTSAGAIRGAISALDDYSGGACPLQAEQTHIWNGIKSGVAEA